jgi:hypothetical protein
MEGWRTGAAWLKGRNSQGGREEQNILTRKKEKKQKSTLDSYRPSHGRTWQYAAETRGIQKLQICI